jgi:hypothetical protein
VSKYNALLRRPDTHRNQPKPITTLNHIEVKDLTQQGNQPPEKPKSSRHWILWTLAALFIVLSITAMMMADYYFAPGSGGTTSEPKDAAEK